MNRITDEYIGKVAGLNIDFEKFRAIPIFQGMSHADLEWILGNSHFRHVEEGGFFFYQGDPAEHMYVLTKGSVKLSQVTPDGQQVILNLVGPWEMFAVISFIKEAKYPISAEATADCEALSWSHASLRRMAERFPNLSTQVMQLMSQRMGSFQSRIMELSTERVERRLARVLLRLVRQVGKKTEGGVLVDMAITRQELAEMSGTTLYTVSRILSKWERQGLIDAGRERVLIRFPHGLVKIAEDIPGNGE